MKLLLYSHDWAPTVGGVQTVTLLLAKGLARGRASEKNGAAEPIDVTLVTPTPRGEMDDAALPYRVVRAPTTWQLIGLLRQADLVHLAGPTLKPLALGWLLRKPIVVEHHGFQTICPNGQLFYTPTQSRCPGHFMAGEYGECIACNRREGLLRSINQWLLTFARRWLCKRVSANVTPTNWLAAQLQLPRMTTIYHGVPADSEREKFGAAPDAVTFAFLGRLVASKNVALLLRAAGELKSSGTSFHLTIIGDGPERENLGRLTEELGLGSSVSFVQYVPDDRLEIALARVSAVVVPAASGEVFGLAAAENMRHGRFALVPASSAAAEVVGDAGLTFSEDDAAGLAEAMKRVITDGDLRVRLAAAARERCRTLFGDAAMVDGHIFLYKSLVL